MQAPVQAQQNTRSQQSNDNNDPRRRKVVEILSQTANGCLKELGFHPEFQQRMKQADNMIENLKFQNAKLFVENRTMNSHLAVQNDRVSFHESSADEQWRQTVDLRERNHLLHLQHGELMKKFEAFVAGLPNEQAYRQLLSDLNHVQGQYRQAVSENTTLRFEVQRLTDQCVKHGLFVRPQGPVQRPSRGSQGSISAVSTAGSSQDRRKSSDGASQAGLQNLHALADLATGPYGSLSAAHSRSSFSFPLTIDTTHSATSQPPSIASAPPERRSSMQDFRLRPVPASAEMNTRRSSHQVIDLTDNEQGPRKRIKLDSHPDASNFTPDCQYDMDSVSTAPPNLVDPNMRHLDNSQTLAPATTALPLEVGTTQPGPVAVAPSTTLESDGYEQCVDEIIEEPDAEGRRVCKLCTVRHSVNLISELPKPWINATLEQLVAHCRDDHPAAWQQLVDGEDEEDEDENPDN